MLDLSGGVKPGKLEDEYQRWRKSPNAHLVLSLTRGRNGKWSLHSPRCRTMWYPLPETHSQRSGRVCCESDADLDGWLRDHKLTRGALNICSYCLGPRSSRGV